ncbi:hypothetical protein SAMN05216464_113127 [Mucilaginibacter pineti]|uniref:Uncharacterized protein n=1 Tax=Mucilaginibacter pineti TaxID=1391627 RepID=A0A1G7IR62_9SPHI|nr:hypothetical protein [Mucilaginibacter pineti]SDF15056.1 hypothetical protein SAMN05216464_113127 [Mucilaginibacter pineti]
MRNLNHDLVFRLTLEEFCGVIDDGERRELMKLVRADHRLLLIHLDICTKLEVPDGMADMDIDEKLRGYQLRDMIECRR